MKVIKSVLKEELANSLAMKKSYERDLAKLPKGSLVKKKIKGHEYYYLQVREKGKGRFIYKANSLMTNSENTRRPRNTGPSTGNCCLREKNRSNS